MQHYFRKLQGDKVIWTIMLILSLVSLLAVYSAISGLAYSKADGNSLKFLIKQMAVLGIGFAMAYGMHKVPYKYLSKASLVLIWFSGAILFFTLLKTGDINSARRWIKVPFIGLTFQSSDLAKLILVIFVARQLNHYRTRLHEFWPVVMQRILLPIGVICGLILPADFSTAGVLFGVCFMMLFIGGVPFKHLLKITGLGIAFILLTFSLGAAFPSLFPRLGTWKARIERFSEPSEEGEYQSNYAQVAIYKGGLIPSGPGSGSSRNYLPQAYNDMIFAFIIEEYGSIIGGLGIVLLYLILLFRSIRLALRCPKHFGGLLAIGLSLLLVTQAMVNMGVAVRLFPTTGQPLPLISMGGTAVLFTSLALGIILSVSRSANDPDEDNKGSDGDEILNSPIHA